MIIDIRYYYIRYLYVIYILDIIILIWILERFHLWAPEGSQAWQQDQGRCTSNHGKCLCPKNEWGSEQVFDTCDPILGYLMLKCKQELKLEKVGGCDWFYCPEEPREREGSDVVQGLREGSAYTLEPCVLALSAGRSAYLSFLSSPCSIFITYSDADAP